MLRAVTTIYSPKFFSPAKPKKQKGGPYLMNKKEDSLPKAGPSEIGYLGIPAFDRAEKLTAIIPIKVQPSLKRALKQVTKNVSEFGRQAIIEKLARLEEEEETFE